MNLDEYQQSLANILSDTVIKYGYKSEEAYQASGKLTATSFLKEAFKRKACVAIYTNDANFKIDLKEAFRKTNGFDSKYPVRIKSDKISFGIPHPKREVNIKLI